MELMDMVLFDRTYRTGPQATTELHAGGIFFHVLYEECLQFRADGQVRHWFEVMDGSCPLDDEAQQMSEVDETGTCAINQRGYLTCKLADFSYTGKPFGGRPGLLAFNVYNHASQHSFSCVYLAPDI